MKHWTPITCLRLKPELVELIDASVVRCNKRRKKHKYTRTSWIVQAIKERLEKLDQRNRSDRKRRARPAAEEHQAEEGEQTPAEVISGEPEQEASAGRLLPIPTLLMPYCAIEIVASLRAAWGLPPAEDDPPPSHR